MLELYARLFEKIKENYALRREIQTRLKSKRRLIRQQIIEENIGAGICSLAMQCNVCNVFNVLAAGDKRSLGPGLLRWRPSVFTRDRRVSGESAGSRVTVSSITSTTSSLADSTIMAGGNILQQESNDYSKTFITLHFDFECNAMCSRMHCLLFRVIFCFFLKQNIESCMKECGDSCPHHDLASRKQMSDLEIEIWVRGLSSDQGCPVLRRARR